MLKTEPDEEAGRRRPEADLLGDEDREDGLAPVVGEALEELEHVGDPERPAEAAAQLVDEAQRSGSSVGSGDDAFLSAEGQPRGPRLQPSSGGC